MGILGTVGVEAGQGKHYEEAIYTLALIYNIITDEMTRYLSAYELTLGKFNILMAVKHQGGKEDISQVDVSKRLIVTPSNMTKLIDKLEKDAFVTRSSLDGDRRVNILQITPKGSKLLDSVWKGYEDRLQKLLSSLSPSEQKVLASLLGKVLENVRE